ncbi:hypothetical protein JRQ81_000607 [Phrynocephalus forsythii]|uniref:Uncharacterized protein n=1 Tax=Phrynocephalus forsythii TaxID=171643 RepID=A0A9Q1B7K9_9SAUR|nr:hypothetical protein JRQ81_000607 [Phrynocephalus forsythii]
MVVGVGMGDSANFTVHMLYIDNKGIIIIIIKRAIKPEKNNTKLKRKNSSQQTKYFLPCIKEVMDHTDKVLKKHNLKTVFRPTTKLQQMLSSAKGTHSPLQEYTRYLVVLARYMLGPQSTASRPESKNMKDIAD